MNFSRICEKIIYVYFFSSSNCYCLSLPHGKINMQKNNCEDVLSVCSKNMHINKGLRFGKKNILEI